MAKKILYTPSPSVSSFVDLGLELRRIQEGLAQAADHMATEISTQSPQKTVEFQIRYADGVRWNPRGLGEGLYIFVGGVWKKFNLT